MSSEYTEVFAWGDDHFGQLGLSENGAALESHPRPRFCSFNVLISDISCGEEHTIFIAADGLLYAMGSNIEGRLGINDRSSKFSSCPWLIETQLPSRPVKVSCGWGHSAVVCKNGEVYSWGIGEYGALGTGSRNTEWAPTRMSIGQDVKARNVSCGNRHTAIIARSTPVTTSILMCGLGDAGQLGLGHFDTELQPKPVIFGEDIRQVSCGIFHTVFCTKSGKVYAMGGNSFGQLGIGSKRGVNRPEQIKGFHNTAISKVSAGHHSAAVSKTGDLYIWGTGAFGEFLTPSKMHGIKTRIRSVDIGGCFGSAVDSSGKLWTWGANSSGELGHGDFKTRDKPTIVEKLQNKTVTKISCGGCFIVSLGKNTTKNKAKGPAKLSQSYMVQSRRGSSLTVKSPGRALKSKSPGSRCSKSSSAKKPRANSRRRQLSKSALAENPAQSTYISDLQNEMNRLWDGPGGIYELRAKIDDLQEENSKEAHRRQKKEDELNTTRRETSCLLEQSEIKISDIQAELHRTAEENEELKRKADEIDSLKEKIRQLQAEVGQNHVAENQRFTFGQAKEELTNKASTLEQQLDDERVKVQQLEQDLVISDQHRLRIEELLKEKTDSVEKLSFQVQSLTTEKDNITSDETAAKQAYGNLHMEYERIKLELQTKTTELNTKNEILDSLSHHYDLDYEEQDTSNGDAMRKLKRKHKEALDDKDIVEAQLKNAQFKLQSSEEQIRSLQRDNEELTNAKEILNAQLKEKSIQIPAHEDQIRSISRENEELRSQKDILQTQLKDQFCQIEALTQLINSFEERFSCLNTENTLLKKEIDCVHQKNQSLFEDFESIMDNKHKVSHQKRPSITLTPADEDISDKVPPKKLMFESPGRDQDSPAFGLSGADYEGSGRHQIISYQDSLGSIDSPLRAKDLNAAPRYGLMPTFAEGLQKSASKMVGEVASSPYHRRKQSPAEPQKRRRSQQSPTGRRRRSQGSQSPDHNENQYYLPTFRNEKALEPSPSRHTNRSSRKSLDQLKEKMCVLRKSKEELRAQLSEYRP